MKLIRKHRKEISCACIVVLTLTIIARFYCYRQDINNMRKELQKLNQAEQANELVPCVEIKARFEGETNWESTGLIVNPHNKFQILVKFWNNSDTIICKETNLSGRSNDIAEMSAQGKTSYNNNTTNECILAVEDNQLAFYIGDQYPGDTYQIEQNFISRAKLIGSPTIEAITYTTANEHFVSSRTYWIGSVPFISWTMLIVGIFVILYIIVAILWQAYDDEKRH